MSGRTPQQMTRDNLTARGYLVGSVERRKQFPDCKKHQCGVCGHNPMVSVSEDLWNVFDIVALRPMPPLGQYRPSDPIKTSSLVESVIFVQTTSRTNHAARRNKILASMEAKLVLLSGARILIQSWRQIDGARSKWQAHDEWITLDQYKQAPHYPNTVAELVEIKRRAKKPDLPPGSTLPLSVDFAEIPF